MSFRNQTRRWNRQMLSWISPKQLALLLLGTAILSFGMHNIHRRVGITEGGVLGMVLLLDHQLSLPPWLMTPVLDIICYLLGLRFLGWISSSFPQWPLWECPLFSGYGSSLRQCCRIFRHIRWQRLCWAAFLWESV